jgi:hypothetical protein
MDNVKAGQETRIRKGLESGEDLRLKSELKNINIRIIIISGL